MENKKPRGFYRKMSDYELVEYTHGQYGDITKGELAKKNQVLYRVLKKRELISKLKWELRSYSGMSDEELIVYAHKLYGDITKGELRKKDQGLHSKLVRRKLISKFKGERKNYHDISDEELIVYAHKLYGEDTTGGELAKKDRRLYQVLQKRGLLDKLSSSKPNLENIVDSYVGGENGK